MVPGGSDCRTRCIRWLSQRMSATSVSIPRDRASTDSASRSARPTPEPWKSLRTVTAMSVVPVGGAPAVTEDLTGGLIDDNDAEADVFSHAGEGAGVLLAQRVAGGEAEVAILPRESGVQRQQAGR